MRQQFSERHDLQGSERDISIREGAPEELREAVVQLAKQAGMTYWGLREVVCEVLLARPSPNNWSDDNVCNEVFWHLENCEWSRVYDIAEAIYADLPANGDLAQAFSYRLNRFFREQGIGWQMEDGEIRYRGPESFMHTTKEARETLAATGRSQAAREMDEAVRAISRRPEPNVTGAVRHAMAALESTARDATRQKNATLGQMVDSLKLKPPLDAALKKLWGYASNEARHGREDSALSATEAELIVGVSGAICSYLVAANRRDS